MSTADEYTLKHDGMEIKFVLDASYARILKMLTNARNAKEESQREMVTEHDFVKLLVMSYLLKKEKLMLAALEKPKEDDEL